MKRKILCVVGTRPEAIKMAPVILSLKQKAWASVLLVSTGQHRQMLDDIFQLFNIVPDIDLNVMRENQSLPSLTARMIKRIDHCLRNESPDAIIAQGDTTTVMVAALTAFYNKIPFGHVEAGLRTRDPHNPFPEEMNRIIVSKLARWHFAPTETAKQNLISEGINNKNIFVTGNPVIDTLLMMSNNDFDIGVKLDPNKRLILITSHRRENFGEPFKNICRAVKYLSINNPDVEFLYPVHPNPNISKTAYDSLGQQDNIHLCEPLSYTSFVAAMKRSYIILSDSGGIQEEAPSLGKPVLVLRNKTERPEAVEHGVVALIGTDFNRIIEETQRLLNDQTAYTSMVRNISPYGDGHSAERIIRILQENLT